MTGAQAAFEESLRDEGFIKPSGAGMVTRGWVHPDLALGFEVVSAVLLDGLADRDRVLFIDVGGDGNAAILSVEDLIADRMGQFASGAAPEMIDQARVMWRLTVRWIATILIEELLRRRWATSRSKISKGVPLEEFGAAIAARMVALGVADPSRNTGNRRTPSKRALLAAIKELGGEW